MNYIEIEKEFKKRNTYVFTPLEFKRIFKVSYNNSKSFLAVIQKRSLDKA